MNRELEEVASHLFRRVSCDLRHNIGKEITSAQFLLLELVNREGSLKVSEAAERLQVTPAAITLMADRLIKNELIVRERDTVDRRVVRLHATKKTHNMLDWYRKERSKLIDKYFNQLSQEDKAHLLRIYKILMGIEK